MTTLLYNYSELTIYTPSYKICGLCKQSYYLDISLTSPYKKLDASWFDKFLGKISWQRFKLKSHNGCNDMGKDAEACNPDVCLQ